MRKDIYFLDFHDIITIAEEILPEVLIRDIGLIKSAAERPLTSVFGEDAYKSFDEKVAALLHSLVRNHPFVDGNKRVSWSAARAFCLMNDRDINLDVDAAEELIQRAAQGLIEISEIAKSLNIKKI